MNAYRFRLKVFLMLFFTVLVFGIAGIMITENKSLFDAFYYAIVTVSTVGYGDIHPTSIGGRIVAMCLIVFGTGTFLGVVANLTEIMLAKRDHQARQDKLHIVMGLYFSEIGMILLKNVSKKDGAIAAIRDLLTGISTWSAKDVSFLKKEFAGYKPQISPVPDDLEFLKELLKNSKSLLIQLLENPVVVEHELFTDILRATFHLYEELVHRKDLRTLPEPDMEHLRGDIKRVYENLIIQWIDYIAYLKSNYPFLFSFAVRTNPFLPQ